MAQKHHETIDLNPLALEVGMNNVLFTLQHQAAPAASVRVAGPAFEVDGQPRGGFNFESQDAPQLLPRSGQQLDLFFRSQGAPDLLLRVRLRHYPDLPILRLQYRLTAAAEAKLTKSEGKDHLRYFCLEAGWLGKADLTEYQFSHFDQVAHSYMPNTEFHPAAALKAGLSFVGPIAWLHNEQQTMLAAYEHGADHPDSFFDFHFECQEGKACSELDRSQRQLLRRADPYTGNGPGKAPGWSWGWMPRRWGLSCGAIGSSSWKRCARTSSRGKPYIFYNTWNYQERNHYFNGRPYLETMHYEQMMAEVELAHRLGVDVFVIDTGWYIKTGDWQVNRQRFPDGLQEVRRKLEGYGMKLGLWFNPTVAALTSRIFHEHPEYQMTRGASRCGREWCGRRRRAPRCAWLRDMQMNTSRRWCACMRSWA